jgi:hypothetical protein
MKTRLSPNIQKAAIVASMFGFLCVSASACTPQTAAVDDSQSYTLSRDEQESVASDQRHPVADDYKYDNYRWVTDGDGNPMLCDPYGEKCQSNPAYDAYRYREFAAGQMPNNNGNFQPFPSVPIFAVTF